MFHSRTKAIYLQAILLLLIIPVVSSFVANQQRQRTLCKQLYLHIEPIHIHRDSLLRLDDPMLLGKDSEKHNWPSKHELHKFTNSLAPLVLAAYLIGYFLTHYHTADVSEATHVTVDPMFGGGILIGTGLYMMKWSVDRTFLSPP